MPSILNWLFVDRRTGRVVVGQPPNFLLKLVLAATALRVVSSGAGNRETAEVFRAAQACALGLWGADEALRGVNPFRRIGGSLVLAAVAWKGLR